MATTLAGSHARIELRNERTSRLVGLARSVGQDVRRVASPLLTFPGECWTEALEQVPT